MAPGNLKSVFGSLKNLTSSLILILLFFTFSISLTFYNKKFIKKFQFPLSITLIHFVVKYVLSVIVRFAWERWKKEGRAMLSWKDFILKISPTGVSCALDIALSNWSFEFVTVSLYTMTKSTAVVFILLFSIVFKLEKPRVSVIGVILLIALGLFLFTYQATQFSLEGFLMVLTAALLSGVRWTTAQLTMQKSEIGLQNPLDMMYHIQPWMILVLFPLALGFEGTHIIATEHVFRYHEVRQVAATAGLVLIGAFLAFFLELSEYMVLVHTSSITLALSGIVKEILTLILAAEVNGDRMSGVNAAGLVVCLLGIGLHVWLKIRRIKGEATEVDSSARERLLSTSDDDDEETTELEIFNAANYVNVNGMTRTAL